MRLFQELLGRSFNKTETYLAEQEQAWVDCAYGFRTGARLSVRPNSETLHNTSLDELHGALEGYRRDYEAGEAAAVLWALRLCLQENLPAPYWCADAFLARLEKMQSNTVSLHDALGLRRDYPGGKRGRNARRSNEDGMRLWMAAWEHHAAHPDASKEECIRLAREKLKLHRLSLSTARNLFNDFDAKQARYRKARGRRDWKPFPDLHTLGKRRKRV